jgi:hypothetical protein
MLLTSIIAANAQCDKNVKLTSSKTEYLDSAMSLQKSEDEKTVIELTGKEVMIAPGNQNHVMTGAVQSATCNWTVPFKEGKSVIKAKMNLGNEEKDATITIQGKDGQLTLLFEVTDIPNQKIRVPIDTFEEKQ